MKIGLISLGCPKNLVDSECMLGILASKEYELTEQIEEADIVIINTCAFIESAKEEAINTILETAQLKEQGALHYLIVTGCLSQRYSKELYAELPEVDAFVGTECYGEIASVLERIRKGERFILVREAAPTYSLGSERIVTTPPYTAYLKIAEGCDNCCSYCAIPAIRGPYRSRPIEEVVAEAERLAASGVRELVLVAQDTTRYGDDLYGRPCLAQLLKQLHALPAIKWLRILYCYPEYMTEELIDTIADLPKVCKYIDLPLQHASDRILMAMNRPEKVAGNRALLKRLRERIPYLCLRSTFIVGFPGETEEDFTCLKEFLQQVRFNCAGVFQYSAEDGTVAAHLPDQVPAEVKEERYHELMAIQAQIAEELAREREGSEVEVVVEGFDAEEPEIAIARSMWEGPDIDGKVYIENAQDLKVGDFVKVRIQQGFTYDVVAERVE